MTAQVPDYFLDTLEKAGYYRDGEPLPGVFGAAELRNPATGSGGAYDRAIKYRAVIDPSKLNAQAVFELSGSPCIYFAHVDEAHPSSARLAELRRYAWNHSLAPVLWVVTPAEVVILNAFERPVPSAENTGNSLLRRFKQVAGSLEELNSYAGRAQFEAGDFWERAQIQRSSRVDAALLRDLNAAQSRLKDEGLSAPDAHALLLRSIFVSYLTDRRILTEDFLEGRFGDRDFRQILVRSDAAEALFEWLAGTFNGDLFPHENPPLRFELRHLDIVRQLLSGVNLDTGQGSLWPYRFDFIPVELISSVYQMFAHALDPIGARDRSTHYTPLNLVDLVLSQVFPGLSGEARVLDPACGSGVFLVEALRRLVAIKLSEGAQWTRELVRECLYQQIFGVDINPGAIRVTAFSLYLTALELDPDPQLTASDELRFKPLVGTNLFDQDAMDPQAPFNTLPQFSSHRFQAVIGNPPWTKSPATDSAVRYCQEHDPARPLADGNPPDQAFLWRCADFATADGRICLVMAGKPFFSQGANAQAARAALLQRFRPRTLINLADYREQYIFPRVADFVAGARAPAVILIADARASDQQDTAVVVAPKLVRHFQKHGIVYIGAQDINRVSVDILATDPDALKVASWGTARDLALIRRLRSTPHLRTLGAARIAWGWPKPGRGIEWGGSKPLKEGFPDRYLPAGALTPFGLQTRDLTDIPEGAMPRRGHDTAVLYQAPLLLVVRGVGRTSRLYAALSFRDVLFNKGYFGIPCGKDDRDETRFRCLNGILNSNLASYFLFLTSAAWAVERNQVEGADLLRIPVVEPDECDPEAVKALLAAEHNLRKFYGAQEESQSGLFQDGQPHTKGSGHKPAPKELQLQLNEAVSRVYGLSQAEHQLVNDTVQNSIDFFHERGSSRATARPSQEDLSGYAAAFVETLSPFLDTLNERAIESTLYRAPKATVCVAHFQMVPREQAMLSPRVIQENALDPVLERIARQLETKLAPTVYAKRYLRLYNGNELFLLKPAERRFWTRSAGRSDADTILAEHLEGQQ